MSQITGLTPPPRHNSYTTPFEMFGGGYREGVAADRDALAAQPGLTLSDLDAAVRRSQMEAERRQFEKHRFELQEAFEKGRVAGAADERERLAPEVHQRVEIALSALDSVDAQVAEVNARLGRERASTLDSTLRRLRNLIYRPAEYLRDGAA